MAVQPLSVLEREARRARDRLSIGRAKVYAGKVPDAMVAQLRLQRLEAASQAASKRLADARSKLSG